MSNQTKLRRLCSLTLVALPVECVSVTRSGLLALTLDEARRISTNIAKLPDLLQDLTTCGGKAESVPWSRFDLPSVTADLWT